MHVNEKILNEENPLFIGNKEKQTEKIGLKIARDILKNGSPCFLINSAIVKKFISLPGALFKDKTATQISGM